MRRYEHQKGRRRKPPLLLLLPAVSFLSRNNSRGGGGTRRKGGAMEGSGEMKGIQGSSRKEEEAEREGVVLQTVMGFLRGELFRRETETSRREQRRRRVSLKVPQTWRRRSWKLLLLPLSRAQWGFQDLPGPSRSTEVCTPPALSWTPPWSGPAHCPSDWLPLQC